MKSKISTIFVIAFVIYSTQTLSLFNQIQTIKGLNIKDLAISSENQKLILGTLNGEIYVYTQKQGIYEENQQIKSINSQIGFIKISFDGKWLMIVDVDNNVNIYHFIQNSEKFQHYQHLNYEDYWPILNAYFLQKYQTILLETQGGKLRILNLEDSSIFKQVKQISIRNKILKIQLDNSLCFIHTQKQVITYSLTSLQIISTVPQQNLISQSQNTIYKNKFVKIKNKMLRDEEELQNKIKAHNNNGQIVVVRENRQEVKIYKKNQIISYERQDQNQSQTLAWQWIMIIVCGILLLIVFVGVIVYEWVFNRQDSSKQNRAKTEQKKNPQEEIDKNVQQSQKNFNVQEDPNCLDVA